MADLAPSDRLQPCLLDRLIDDQPQVKVEGRSQRVISMQRFKEGVLRDLRWLFNSQKRRPGDGLEEFPHANRSVLNFGIRDFQGMFSEGMDVADIEREVHEMLLLFEPRIIRRTLKVRVFRAEESGPQRNPHCISLEIAAELWAQPFPEKFFAKTEIDLETGLCSF